MIVFEAPGIASAIAGQLAFAGEPGLAL